MCSDRRLLAVSSVAVLLALSACGKRGDPQPRPRAVPQSATDLTVRQRGLELRFEVSYPKATVAGLPIEGLASATLYEAQVPALLGGKAPTLRNDELEGAAKPVLELVGPALDAAIVGDKLRFRLELPETALAPLPPPAPVVQPVTAPATPPATQPATAPATTPAPAPAPAPATTPTVPPATTPAVVPSTTPAVANSTEVVTVPARVYSVRTKEVRGLTSGWSNAVGLVPRVSPPPPGALAVTPRKEGVALDWTAASRAVGYIVLRREATDPEWGAPVATLPPSAVSYVDRGALYGTRYVYTVLSLTQSAPPIESAPQSAHEVDYRDLFAPEPPTELRALFVAGQVRLVWEASLDADLAGYLVERSIAGRAFAALPGELATGTDTTDPEPPAGVSVRYRLVAVDRAGNAAPPTEPVAIALP